MQDNRRQVTRTSHHLPSLHLTPAPSFCNLRCVYKSPRSRAASCQRVNFWVAGRWRKKQTCGKNAAKEAALCWAALQIEYRTAQLSIILACESAVTVRAPQKSPCWLALDWKYLTWEESGRKVRGRWEEGADHPKVAALVGVDWKRFDPQGTSEGSGGKRFRAGEGGGG